MLFRLLYCAQNLLLTLKFAFFGYPVEFEGLKAGYTHMHKHGANT